MNNPTYRDLASLQNLQLTDTPLQFQTEHLHLQSQTYRIQTPQNIQLQHPKDARVIQRLRAIHPTDGRLVKLYKFFRIINTNPALWKLVLQGIQSGLAHGTTDIIYRLGLNTQAAAVLDNLDIAVGTLHRRIIIANTISRILRAQHYPRLISIAGGSCLLAIEGFYQSGNQTLHIHNFDTSPKAAQKAQRNLAAAQRSQPRHLHLTHHPHNLLSDEIPLESPAENGSLYECTGFWEYLDPIARPKFLSALVRLTKSRDTLLLTLLLENPQQDIFNNIGFKKLHPTNLQTAVAQIAQYFTIQEIIVTNNRTYGTFTLTAPKILP